MYTTLLGIRFVLWVNIANNMERNETSSQSKASFHSHMGLSNNAVSPKLLQFFAKDYWTKNLSFWPYNRYSCWNSLARSDPAMTLFDGLFLRQFKKMDFQHKFDTCFKIVVTNFELKCFFICFEIITLFVYNFFLIFSYIYAYNSRATGSFLILIVSHERPSPDLSELL